MIKNLLITGIPPGIEAINLALKLVGECEWNKESPSRFAENKCTYIYYGEESQKYYYSSTSSSPDKEKHKHLTTITFKNLVYTYINYHI